MIKPWECRTDILMARCSASEKGVQGSRRSVLYPGIHVEIVAGTTQARSFNSASAPARDEAGFWPVTSLPSVTTKLAQSAAFS